MAGAGIIFLAVTAAAFGALSLHLWTKLDALRDAVRQQDAYDAKAHLARVAGKPTPPIRPMVVMHFDRPRPIDVTVRG